MKFNVPIETSRLRLRFFSEADLADVYAYHSNDEVVRYLYWVTRSEEEALKEIQRRISLKGFEKDGDALILAVEEKESKKVIGEVFLFLRSQEHQQGELGYVFNPDFQGKGFAFEASEAVLKAGFEEAGLHRIFARCDARNDSSYRLMERLGMRKEAHLVQNEFFKGEWGDELVYALLAEEWENKKV